MKKWIAYSLFALAILAGVVVISFQSLSIDKPTGTIGKQADSVALQCEEVMGKSALNNVRYLRWRFVGKHHFVWDKTKKICLVEFDDYRIFLSFRNPDVESMVFEKNKVLTDDAVRRPLIKKALDYFNNDSFWLLGPTKFFDEGCVRSIVNTDSDDFLLTEYNKGGSTPGDAYLWSFNEDMRPASVNMFTSNLPISGMHFSWEDYKEFDNGVCFAQSHKFWFLNIRLDQIEMGNSMQDLKLAEDTFSPFLS